MNKNITDKALSISTLVIFAIFLICSSCSKQNSENTTKAESYQVLTMEPYDVILYREFPATLKSEQVVEIRPKVDGYIEKIFVKEGDNVKKGQLLFTLFNPSYSQEIESITASIKSAEADISTAEVELNNMKALVDSKVVGDYQLKVQQNELENKKQALQVYRANLATQRTNVGYTKILAPADGVISTIPYKVGALVSSSSTDALTTFAGVSNMHAYFSVSEQDLLSYNNDLGSRAYLVLPNDSVYTSEGNVFSASGMVNTTTGSVTYNAIFPNFGGKLKSGGFATVRIPYTITNALAIPQTATYELQDKRYAYVVGKGNKISSKIITTTPTNDGQYFIVNSGLKKGDKIVINGVGVSLKDDMIISPVEAKRDSVFNKLILSK